MGSKIQLELEHLRLKMGDVINMLDHEGLYKVSIEVAALRRLLGLVMNGLKDDPVTQEEKEFSRIPIPIRSWVGKKKGKYVMMVDNFENKVTFADGSQCTLIELYQAYEKYFKEKPQQTK